MCVKKVYHNFYADGQEDVTERVQSCTPGHLCPHPIVQHKDRHFSCARSEALSTPGKRETSTGGLQPSPIFVSPAPTSSSTASRRSGHTMSSDASSGASRRLSGTWSTSSPRYVTSSTTSPAGSTASPSRRSSMRGSPSERPPSTPHSRAIPIQRSSPMSSHNYYTTAPPHTPPESRGRRAIIHDDYRDTRDRRDSRDSRDGRTSTRRYSGVYDRSDYDLPRMTTTSASPSRHSASPSASAAAATASSASSTQRPPVDVFEHASSARLRDRFQRRDSLNHGHYQSNSASSAAIPRSSTDFLHPNVAYSRPRANSSPQGYGSAEDEHDRSERRRRRQAAREQASVTPSSLPAFGNTDVYGSSYLSSHIGSGASSRNSSSHSRGGDPYNTTSYPPRSASTRRSSVASGSGLSGLSGGSSPGSSPAVNAVKKELRWEDEQRAAQNARIAARPKLPRSQTIRDDSHLQGEVKSILKNGNGSATNTPAASPKRSASTSSRMRRSSMSSRDASPARRPSSRRSSVLVDGDDDVFTNSFSNMDIRGRTGSMERRSDDEYKRRLRERFEAPPRRYTAGGSHRRRTEVIYPEPSRYRAVH